MPPVRVKLPTAATPMAFAHAILEAYSRYGQDPARALAMAQITPAELKEVAACITAKQMELLSGTAMRELDDEALGWFGRRLPWGSYGMLARASISAPTLGIALKRWCRHHGLLTNDLQLSVDVDGSVASISITEAVCLGALREFCLLSVLRNVHGLGCWLIDSRIPIVGCSFPFEAPAHAWVYSILFSDATQFGGETACIRFDARYLNLPLRRDEQALHQMLQHALPLTVLQYRRDRLLVQRVLHVLASETHRIHNAVDLAAKLHLSARTLHRQLRDEGATLQGLKDEVRRTRAQELLNRSKRPIKQVAQAAGFQNEKSFIRAFRQWTGQTPAEYRRQGPPAQTPG